MAAAREGEEARAAGRQGAHALGLGAAAAPSWA
jgi:hypothetical protein